jgi:hypothetical protein
MLDDYHASKRDATRVSLEGQLREALFPASQRALALVAEWVAIHEGELAANWERARREEPLEPIGALA